MSPVRSLVFLLCCVSLNVNAGLPFMSETVAWDEEVLLANGQLLSVHREATYWPDEWGRSGRGGLKKQSLRFSHNGKAVKWVNDDQWPIVYMPDILDVVGDMPVLVMPVYRFGPCTKYDFPQEGLVAFAYRDGNWSRIPFADLPTNLKVNLLRSTHDIRHSVEFTEKLVTPSDKMRLETSGWGGTKPGLPILEASNSYAAGSQSCARIRPLPNSQLDSAAEKIMKAEINAPILVARLKHSNESPRIVAFNELPSAERSRIGFFGYISGSCKAIVDNIENISSYIVVDGVRKNELGYVLILKNGSKIPIKLGIFMEKSRAFIDAVVCSDSKILTIKRYDKEQLIVHRFSQAGNLLDAFRVHLSDVSQYFSDQSWPMVLEVQPNGETFQVTLGRYSRTPAPDREGGLEQSATYEVQLPN